VNYLARTAQLRDYIAFAQQNGYTFRLVIRKGIWPFTKGTEMSTKLKAEIKAGQQAGYIELVKIAM